MVHRLCERVREVPVDVVMFAEYWVNNVHLSVEIFRLGSRSLFSSHWSPPIFSIFLPYLKRLVLKPFANLFQCETTTGWISIQKGDQRLEVWFHKEPSVRECSVCLERVSRRWCSVVFLASDSRQPRLPVLGG